VSALGLSCHDLGAFFEARHGELATRLGDGTLEGLRGQHEPEAVAMSMGHPLGLYAFLVPETHGGAPVGRPADARYVDVRSLCLVREALGQVSPLADAIFAVQGLGTYPLVLAGSDAQRARWMPDLLSGKRVAAFALTEPEAGSDVASMTTTARRDGDGWVLDGDKTLISNVPIAAQHVVFANADPSKGKKGITAFVVERDAPGLEVSTIPMSVPHPIGKLALRACKVPDSARLGEVGQGLRIALGTLETFRISVGAAACGMARHALAQSIAHVKRRRQFGAPLADQQMVKAYLAEMATELDAARLLVARAAHRRDTVTERVPREAAMAKMYATEAAQRIIDKAVQLHGGLGVTTGSDVESLYREIRPLRIYEGTTEIQKLIIARSLLEDG
jgi:acyl-CoA dehydrogenase